MRYVLILLWRVWFYMLIILSIILLLPLLLISISKQSWYPFFFRLARIWGKLILYGMGFVPRVDYDEPILKEKSYVFVSNHVSMIDIMMMLYLSKNPFVFVGKKELARFPVFGFFYRRTCILVDRENPSSRHAVYKQAQERLSKGLSVCIFPEGGVPDDENIVLDTFRDGAFRLAINHQIPIVPIVFYDSKKRFSYNFFSGGPGILRAKILPFVSTKGLTLTNKRELNQNVRQMILRELISTKNHVNE